MPSLRFGKKFQHGRREQVRSRVPVHLQCFRILRCENFELGVVFERPRQVEQLSIHARHNGIGGQAWADRLCDLDGARPGATVCWLPSGRVMVKLLIL